MFWSENCWPLHPIGTPLFIQRKKGPIFLSVTYLHGVFMQLCLDSFKNLILVLNSNLVVFRWFLLFDFDLVKILAKINEGRAIKEICTSKLAITNGQCYIVIYGCGMNRKIIVYSRSTINAYSLLLHKW